MIFAIAAVIAFVLGFACERVVARMRAQAPPQPPLRVQVFVNGCLVIDCDAVALAQLVAFKGGKPDMHAFRGDVVVGFRIDS